MAGDPLLSHISPSRLRPWKAPKKESSFTRGGFLAGVVCCVRKRGGRLSQLYTNKQLIFVVTLDLLLAHPLEAVVTPEVSFSDQPLCILLGQYGLLSLPLAYTIKTLDMAHGQAADSSKEQPDPH